MCERYANKKQRVSVFFSKHKRNINEKKTPKYSYIGIIRCMSKQFLPHFNINRIFHAQTAPIRST